MANSLAQTIAQDRAQQMAFIKATAQSVKAWYQKNYPSDDIAEHIDPDLTFAQIAACMKKGVYCYSTFWADDSIVRERILGRLARIYNVSYKDFYYLWLAGENVEIRNYPMPITVSVEPVSNKIIVEYTKQGEQKTDIFGQEYDPERRFYYMLTTDVYNQPSGQVWQLWITNTQAHELHERHGYIYGNEQDAERRMMD